MTDWPNDAHEPDDYDGTNAADLLQQIEALQNSDDYGWARDTLEGIYATVENAGYVTDGQQQAIDNIEEGGRRGRRR